MNKWALIVGASLFLSFPVTRVLGIERTSDIIFETFERIDGRLSWREEVYSRLAMSCRAISALWTLPLPS
jgi:hypothetical protein